MLTNIWEWGYAFDSSKDCLNGPVCARRAFVNLRAFASLRWGYKKPPQRLKDAKNHQGFLSAQVGIVKSAVTRVMCMPPKCNSNSEFQWGLTGVLPQYAVT